MGGWRKEESFSYYTVLYGLVQNPISHIDGTGRNEKINFFRHLIIEMDNATLHNVTPQSVIFVVTDGQVDAHDVTEFPFITLAQWSNAKQLIILPLGSFHKLANKVCSWCYKTFFGGNLENLDFLLSWNSKMQFQSIVLL